MSSITSALPALAKSLLSDPFYQAITVDHANDTARLSLLERYFEYSLREAQRIGRCVLAQNPAHGATAWLLPRDAKAEVIEAALKLVSMRRLLGRVGFHNYQGILSFMSTQAVRHVPNDAWYLSIIGVHPAAQGKGIGHELLAPTLGEADQQKIVCYLETFTPANINFYMRCGFKSAAQYEEPTTQSTYALMRREPSNCYWREAQDR